VIGLEKWFHYKCGKAVVLKPEVLLHSTIGVMPLNQQFYEFLDENKIAYDWFHTISDLHTIGPIIVFRWASDMNFFLLIYGHFFEIKH